LRRARPFLVLVGTATLAWLACEEQTSHVYAGKLFDPDADCVYPSTSLDFVLGPHEASASICDAQCITDTDGQVFLSETCPPPPVEFYGAAEAPNCKKALAARCRQCPLDGGGVETVCDAEAE
jgi:hypothetical protein